MPQAKARKPLPSRVCTIDGERFIADAAKLAAAYKRNPTAYHKKERARAEAGLLKHFDQWQRRYCPWLFCEDKGPRPDRPSPYGAALADLRDLQLKPIKTPDWRKLAKISACFVLTVARSCTLMLRASGVEATAAIKSLHECVSVELKYVKRRVFTPAVGSHWSEEIRLAWDSIELQLQNEIQTVLYPALEPRKKVYPTVIGRKIDEFRKEAGLSYDELAEYTAISKTLIINHVYHGTQPQGKNKRQYAKTFSELLHRDITVPELEGKTAPK
jgi:hypothetical protein